jgi:hypothetical protein
LNNSFWLNIYGQIHNLWQTVGIFLVGTLATYLVNTATNEWSWQGIIVSLAAAVATYGLTKNDHAKTGQAVQKAVEQTVITTQEVLEKEKGAQG